MQLSSSSSSSSKSSDDVEEVLPYPQPLSATAAIPSSTSSAQFLSSSRNSNLEQLKKLRVMNNNKNRCDSTEIIKLLITLSNDSTVPNDIRKMFSTNAKILTENHSAKFGSEGTECKAEGCAGQNCRRFVWNSQLKKNGSTINTTESLCFVGSKKKEYIVSDSVLRFNRNMGFLIFDVS
jgi:hypothetical protein